MPTANFGLETEPDWLFHQRLILIGVMSGLFFKRMFGCQIINSIKFQYFVKAPGRKVTNLFFYNDDFYCVNVGFNGSFCSYVTSLTNCLYATRVCDYNANKTLLYIQAVSYFVIFICC